MLDWFGQVKGRDKTENITQTRQIRQLKMAAAGNKNVNKFRDQDHVKWNLWKAIGRPSVNADVSGTPT